MSTKKIMKNPPHVGKIIYQEIIEPLDLSITSAAKILDVSRPTLSNLVNQNASLSWDMAMRIEKAFGPKADHLMRMQFSYDQAQALSRKKAIKVKRYEPA